MEQRHRELVTLIEQYYAQVTTLQQTVSALREQLASLPEQIGYYDLMQNDLLHELELMPLNAVQGTKVLKQLKHVRKERRLYKNIHAFEQLEQQNLQLLAALTISPSPLQTTKTYTYRTVEGYQFHQSLNIERDQHVAKPPNVKRQKAVEEDDNRYHIVRKQKQWQLYNKDVFVVAYKQLSSMHAYLEQHAITLKAVSEHEELFAHYVTS